MAAEDQTKEAEGNRKVVPTNKAASPAKEAAPAQSTNTVQPAKPAQATQPVMQAQPAQPAKTTQPSKPVQQAKPAQPAPPTQPVEQVQPILNQGTAGEAGQEEAHEEAEGGKELAEEDELSMLVHKVTEDNKRLDEEYDERLKRLEDKRKVKSAESVLSEEDLSKVQTLWDELNELKAKISASRKQGNDVLMADFATRNIPSKIKMAEVTGEPKDIAVVKALIKEAEEELKEAEKEPQVNVKKEIEQRLKDEMQKETGRVEEEE